MGYFVDALLTGPEAVADFFINGYHEMLGNILCSIYKVDENKKKQLNMGQQVKPVTAVPVAKSEEDNIKAEIVELVEPEIVTQVVKSEEDNIKAEIVEFRNLRDKVDSILNVDFPITSDEKELSGDELLNTVERIYDTVLNRTSLNVDDEDSKRHIFITTVVCLIALNKVKLKDVMENDISKQLGILTRDELVEMNTIYKFFSGSKIFTKISSVQLNEFITSQLLFDLLTVISEIDNWSMEANMADMLDKAQRRLEEEAISNGKNNGLDEIDPVSPIRFDNSVLNSNLFDRTARIPSLNKTSKGFVIHYLNNIIDKDFIENNHITFDVERKLDENDINRDTGSALLKVIYEDGANIMYYDMDLDSIVGNGYSIAVPNLDPRFPNAVFQTFVNIEKFPEIINKVITSNNNYLLNNGNDPNSLLDYKEVVKDLYGVMTEGCSLWYFFDFTGMSKHFAFMSNEEKIQFAHNLEFILYNVNWAEIYPATGMPRMRIRRFDSVEKFTLSSDKNTRQQNINFNLVLDNNYKKYFKDDSTKVADSNIIVCRFNKHNISIAVNGVDVTPKISFLDK